MPTISHVARGAGPSVCRSIRRGRGGSGAAPWRALGQFRCREVLRSRAAPEPKRACPGAQPGSAVRPPTHGCACLRERFARGRRVAGADRPAGAHGRSIAPRRLGRPDMGPCHPAARSLPRSNGSPAQGRSAPRFARVGLLDRRCREVDHGSSSAGNGNPHGTAGISTVGSPGRVRIDCTSRPGAFLFSLYLHADAPICYQEHVRTTVVCGWMPLRGEGVRAMERSELPPRVRQRWKSCAIPGVAARTQGIVA